MTKRKRAEMDRAVDKSQSKEGTISVALGSPQNPVGTTQQGQGALSSRQGLAAMVLEILEEEMAKHMDRMPSCGPERGNNPQVQAQKE